MDNKEVKKVFDSMIESLPSLFDGTAVFTIHPNTEITGDEYRGFMIRRLNLIEEGKFYLGVDPFY